jgi:hypothetical protein
MLNVINRTAFLEIYIFSYPLLHQGREKRMIHLSVCHEVEWALDEMAAHAGNQTRLCKGKIAMGNKVEQKHTF